MTKTIEQRAESYSAYAYDEAESKYPDRSTEPYDRGYTDAAEIYAKKGYIKGAHAVLQVIERAYVSEKVMAATLTKIHQKINELRGL